MNDYNEYHSKAMQSAEEGNKRIQKCQEFLDKNKFLSGATIHCVAGSISEPVSIITINGPFDMKLLPTLYKILRDN